MADIMGSLYQPLLVRSLYRPLIKQSSLRSLLSLDLSSHIMVGALILEEAVGVEEGLEEMALGVRVAALC